MPAIISRNPMKPVLVEAYREKYGSNVRINGLKYDKKKDFYYADILRYIGDRRYEVVVRDATIPFKEFNNFLSYTNNKWRLEGVGWKFE